MHCQERDISRPQVTTILSLVGVFWAAHAVARGHVSLWLVSMLASLATICYSYKTKKIKQQSSFSHHVQNHTGENRSEMLV